jgi:hypothetical protein
MSQVTIRRPSVNSIWATSWGLSHTQFFISSLIKAHCVRFFSGRLANGARVDLQCVELACDFTADKWHKPVPLKLSGYRDKTKTDGVKAPSGVVPVPVR